jgi:hypothetical protein
VAFSLYEPEILQSDALEFRGDGLGGATAIALVFRQRRDGGNAQQGLQLL